MESTSKPTEFRLENIDEWTPILIRCTMAMGLSRQDAEDATQTAIARLQDIMENEPERVRNPKAYLFTILRNLAKKNWKEKKRFQTIEFDEATSLRTESTESSPTLFDSEDLRAAFSLAYNSLPSNDRDLLKKHYFDGLTYGEIAKELGCSTQNAWKRVKKIVSVILSDNLHGHLQQINPELAETLFSNR